MCWPVWENSKGVNNLFNRNVKQASSTRVWKEPARETKRTRVCWDDTQVPAKEQTLLWPSSRGIRLSWGTLPPSPRSPYPQHEFLTLIPSQSFRVSEGSWEAGGGWSFPLLPGSGALQGTCQTGSHPGSPQASVCFPLSWHWHRRAFPFSKRSLMWFPRLVLKHLCRLCHSSCVPGNGPRHPEASRAIQTQEIRMLAPCHTMLVSLDGALGLWKEAWVVSGLRTRRRGCGMH